jgi:hypothetical protein
MLLVLLACSGGDATPVDSGDVDRRPVFDDSGEVVPTGVISGVVIGPDGAPRVGADVQICDHVCIPLTTGEGGTFRRDALPAGSYKVDALGESAEGADLGHARVHVDLADGAQVAIAEPLYLPRMEAAQTLTSSGRHVFGSVAWTVDPATLAVPFGVEAGTFRVGVVPADAARPWWDARTPAGAVAFLPFGTEVGAPFTVEVAGTWPSASYDVYAVDDKGRLEGPLATASVSGTGTAAVLRATVQPTLLTWLVFYAAP